MKRSVLILLLAFTAINAMGQKVAVKTNLVYGAMTYTPNLSAEFGIGKKSTLEIGGGYNPWNLKGSEANNKKLVHWLGQIEYRYWLCQPYVGHFFGAHALGTQYNIAGHELPMLFGKGSRNRRFEGEGYGAGLSYGYGMYLGRRWGLEATVGGGYVRLRYDAYDCVRCGKKLGSEKKNYFGITKAGISLVYYIR